MAFLQINPRYRELLDQQSLATAARFLALPGVIVCGHPDRHVARVQLGHGDETLTAYLKREHRIRWRARLTNALAGFGLVSHSRREGRLLQSLRTAGVNCPDWIAAGEDGQGRAFVLVRAVPDARELRDHLRSHAGRSPQGRRQLARVVGEALAQMHEMGFDHPDLYSKHLLVGAENNDVHMLDWQRSRQRCHLDWPARWRDLAALHATLADDLVTPRDRLACLHAYLKATLPMRAPHAFWTEAVRHIRKHAQRLDRHRHIRELRETRSHDTQQLIWLDGEALCITPRMHAVWGDTVPAWLAAPAGHPGSISKVTRTTVSVPGVSRATLVRRRTDWPLAWVCTWLCGRRLATRAVEQAGLLFRLERYGVGAPRLLAFGQRHFPPSRSESFLLTESPDGSTTLAEAIAMPVGRSLWSAELKRRRNLLRETAAVVRRMHAAGVQFTPDAHCPLVVQSGRGAPASIVVGSAEDIEKYRYRSGIQGNLPMLLSSMPDLSRTDALRFVLAYIGQPRLTAPARRFGYLVLRKPTLIQRLRAWLFPPTSVESATPIALRRAVG
ncbi:MAG: lipopolysaccharide kinase InaA family protein [Gemmataceae bacterium]|nr:lipopolysaccharide kinase InaA family protein [Gemmataceae bacterium]